MADLLAQMDCLDEVEETTNSTASSRLTLRSTAPLPFVAEEPETEEWVELKQSIWHCLARLETAHKEECKAEEDLESQALSEREQIDLSQSIADLQTKRIEQEQRLKEEKAQLKDLESACSSRSQSQIIAAYNKSLSQDVHSAKQLNSEMKRALLSAESTKTQLQQRKQTQDKYLRLCSKRINLQKKDFLTSQSAQMIAQLKHLSQKRHTSGEQLRQDQHYESTFFDRSEDQSSSVSVNLVESRKQPRSTYHDTPFQPKQRSTPQNPGQEDCCNVCLLF